MSQAKITITFDPDDLDPNNPLDFIDRALVEVGNKEDGTPAVSSGQLLNLLVRILAVMTVLSSEGLQDAYASSCQYSGLVAEAMREALDKEFDFTIVLEPVSRNIN